MKYRYFSGCCCIIGRRETAGKFYESLRNWTSSDFTPDYRDESRRKFLQVQLTVLREIKMLSPQLSRNYHDFVLSSARSDFNETFWGICRENKMNLLKRKRNTSISYIVFKSDEFSESRGERNFRKWLMKDT